MRDNGGKSVRTNVIGGAILAAWKPFWSSLSALSTFDFMRTAGGHPSIGLLFLPTGLADIVTVLGLVLIFIGVFRRQGSSSTAKATILSFPSGSAVNIPSLTPKSDLVIQPEG